MKVKGVEVLRCDAGWRNYHFLKLTTDEGVVGWSEFDEGFGSPGVSAVIERLAGRVVGQPVFDHERIYTELYCFTRPAAGGVVAEGLGAIETALLDAKAKALGVPCHALLGGKVRERIRVYWSHCATWRINHPTLYKPAITSLDGVKAIGAEVRDKGFGALKTNIFIYDGGAPRGWRPGFGVPFLPELNVDESVLRNLRAHLEAIRDGAGPHVDLLLDLNFNAKTEGYLKIRGRSPISRCSGWRSIAIAPRRLRIFAGRARIRSARAKPCSDCANSCLTSARRLWMSRSSMRCGTGSGSR
jgi:galactonate dehydratase